MRMRALPKTFLQSCQFMEVCQRTWVTPCPRLHLWLGRIAKGPAAWPLGGAQHSRGREDLWLSLFIESVLSETKFCVHVHFYISVIAVFVCLCGSRQMLKCCSYVNDSHWYHVITAQAWRQKKEKALTRHQYWHRVPNFRGHVVCVGVYMCLHVLFCTYV